MQTGRAAAPSMPCLIACGQSGGPNPSLGAIFSGVKLYLFI